MLLLCHSCEITTNATFGLHSGFGNVFNPSQNVIPHRYSVTIAIFEIGSMWANVAFV